MKNDDQKVPKIFFGNNMLKSIAKTPSDIPNTSLSSELKIPNLIFGNNMLKSIAKTPSNIPNASLSSELKNLQKFLILFTSF